MSDESEQIKNKRVLDNLRARLGIAKPEKSPGRKTRPIPEPFKHIEVNFCKTPGCDNFAVPPRTGHVIKGRVENTDTYKISGTGSTNLLCTKCNKWSRIKSNRGVHEEFERQSAYLRFESPLRCPDTACANHKPTGAAKDNFRRYGRTHSGSDRWQCRACEKTFSLGKPTKGQKKPHLNQQAFMLLVNKMPLSRMCEVLDVSFATLYGKIDFIYEQCRLFAADREAKFRDMEFRRLYLATDRQDYLINWGERSSRKTIQLTGIGTADLKSGYVFGLTPNYDSTVTPQQVEDRFELADDADVPPAMRETARFWTMADYQQSVKSVPVNSIKEDIATRDDLDAPELLSNGQQLPSNGAQIHADYLMSGHFWYLRSMLHGVGKVRFFLDQDQGLLAACVGAFSERIRDRTSDVVIVDIQKSFTVDERKVKHRLAKRAFQMEHRTRFPGLGEKAARTAMLAEKIAAARAARPDRNLQDVWFDYPFPDMAEPEKRLRYATDLGDFDDHHLANLLIKATLWPIDTVFNRIRRRIALFERPVASVRRARRSWHIYAPYDPQMVEKLLTIYRVWHNFVWEKEATGKTAAELIGLANGRVRIQDILYFDVRTRL